MPEEDKSLDRRSATSQPVPLSVGFVNTRHAVRGRLHDVIATPGQLGVWLHQQAAVPGLIDFRADMPNCVAGGELAAFHDLRAAIGTLFRAAAEQRIPPPDALAHINDTALLARSAPALVAHGLRYALVERGLLTGLPAARGVIARDAVHVLAGEPGLHACHGPGCVLLFVTHDARRRWCSAGCGNRARAARHYDRQREHRSG
ncbi:MAG: CGNR zinc finger domain-containing protein [Micromonosporaceae bacterium]